MRAWTLNNLVGINQNCRESSYKRNSRVTGTIVYLTPAFFCFFDLSGTEYISTDRWTCGKGRPRATNTTNTLRL